ncbi:hypothetical protein GY50_1483 [Dehalococcoides mccartyi GY50]|nr:hypothetical protein GY50_1483 [Dehalococcoides mccartyi GY50]
MRNKLSVHISAPYGLILPPEGYKNLYYMANPAKLYGLQPGWFI